MLRSVDVISELDGSMHLPWKLKLTTYSLTQSKGYSHTPSDTFTPVQPLTVTNQFWYELTYTLFHPAQIKQAINKSLLGKSITRKPEPEETKFNNLLSYMKGVIDKINRTLIKQNIRTIFIINNKVSNIIRFSKNTIPIEIHGDY